MNKIKIIFLSLALISLASCGIFKHQKKTVLTESNKLDNTSDFIDGCKEKILGDTTKAISTFLSCIKTDPSNAAAYYELAGLYYLTKKNQNALACIEKAVKLEPENAYFQLLFANILIYDYHYKDATAIYEKLAEAHPENIEYFFDWAEGYLYEGKYANAIDVYNQVEQKMGVSEELSIQKEKIYLQINKFDKAVDEVQKLINAFPSEPDYYNYLADLYMMNNMPDKAYEQYQKILSINPNNANVHLSLAEYYRSKGDKDKSFDELKLAFSNPNLDIDTKVKILLSYYTISENNNDLKKQAYELLDLLVKTDSTEAKTFSIYGDFLYRDKKTKEARDEYFKAVSLDSSRFAIWKELLLLESQLNDNTALAKESKKALDLFPEQPILYLFNGAADYNLKKYENAISVLNKGLSYVVYDDELFKQFYTYLGDADYAKQNYKDAFSYYDKVLKIDSGNVYILNNYSYYLSLRGENLDKAERMAKKAVDLSPSNSSYLDTYGWALYKQAKYSDAETWLQKALDNGGDSSAVILEHYGDTLFKLGETDKAVEYWQKAKEKGKGSDMLEKKINDKKIYE